MCRAGPRCRGGKYRGPASPGQPPYRTPSQPGSPILNVLRQMLRCVRAQYRPRIQSRLHRGQDSDSGMLWQRAGIPAAAFITRRSGCLPPSTSKMEPPISIHLARPAGVLLRARSRPIRRPWVRGETECPSRSVRPLPQQARPGPFLLHGSTAPELGPMCRSARARTRSPAGRCRLRTSPWPEPASARRPARRARSHAPHPL
jgi:hypothetical protein